MIEMSKKSCESWHRWAQTLSLVALPLIVAFGGWYMSYLQLEASRKKDEALLRKEFVQLAIQILQAKESTSELRDWAVKLVNYNSVIPLSEPAAKQLVSGEASIPGPGWWQGGWWGPRGVPGEPSKSVASLLWEIAKSSDKIARDNAIEALHALDTPEAKERLKDLESAP